MNRVLLDKIITPIYIGDMNPSDNKMILSLRRNKYNQQIACSLRESGSDTVIDIGFNGDGTIRQWEILSHCGANSGYVAKIFDPSGNGNHATQSTADNQPRIVNAGVLDVDANGKPTMYFDGTKDVMTIANGASVDILGAPLMMNAVFNSTNTGNGYIIAKNLDSAATIQYASIFNVANSRIDNYLEGSVRQSTANSSTLINNGYIYSFEFVAGSQQGYVNGTSSGSAGNYNSTLTSRANMNIGARSNNVGNTAWNSFFKGNISEIIILTSTSGRSKLERSQSKYYQIGVA